MTKKICLVLGIFLLTLLLNSHPAYAVTVPSGILYYVPVTLNNTKGATPTPYQQNITVNSSKYSSYEASDLSNVEWFYDNGTVIPSWLEYGSSSSANTSYWLKIDNISANTVLNVNMGFVSTSTNLFSSSGNTGEAPTLSATYGNYDNGANVFTQYGGKSWSSFTYVGGTWSTTNGYLQQTATTGTGLLGGQSALIESANYSNAGNYTLEMAFNYTTQANARVGIVAVGTTSGTDTNAYRFIGQQNSNGAGFISFLNDQLAWVVNNVYQGAVSTPYTMSITNVGGSWSGNLYAGFSVFGTSLTSLTSTAYTTANKDGKTSGYVGISACYYDAVLTGIPNPINVMWFRMRAYPPSGTMPTSSFGSVIETTPPIITISSPTNTTYASSSVWANVTLNEAGSWCGRSLDSGSNTTMTNSTGNWNNQMTSLADGSHNVRFYCNDTTGNMNGSASNIVYFSVDATPPSLSIQLPQNTSYSSNNTWFNATANKALTWMYVNWGAGNKTMTNATGNWYYQNSSMPDGIYTAIFYANDTAGNQNKTNVTFTIDTTKPIIELNLPANAATAQPKDLTFNFTATDNIATSMICSIYIDNVLNQTNSSTRNNTLTNFNINGISEGLHYWNITCNDTVGNGNWSSTRSFTVNVTPILTSVSASPSSLKDFIPIYISP